MQNVYDTHLLKTHNRADVFFEHGDGAYLFTKNGDKYLDFTAGVAVTSLGHNNKELNEALKAQVDKIWHFSNLYQIEIANIFAKNLCEKTFADVAFFSNSGAEAVEAGIKMIRRYFYVQNKPHKNQIIAFKNSFHGRTIATISAAGNPKYIEGFEPKLQGFVHAEYGNLESVKNLITESTAGILLEPIQGEGGVSFAGWDFLKSIRKICDEHGILLMLDEIQCGYGRTGKLFAHEWADVAPDILCAAKAIANGIPLAATLATQNVANCMTPGTHGTTFGCNPLAMAVGIKVLEIMHRDSFFENSQKISDIFESTLRGLHYDFPNIIISTRGFGFLRGIELHQSYINTKIVEILRGHKLLATVALNNIVRFLPPLIITESHIREFDEIMRSVLRGI